MGQQVAAPRLFKSHESASDVPAGARYVYVARNPLDAFVSFHRFLPAYTGLQPGDITAERFAEAIFAGASHSGQIYPYPYPTPTLNPNPNPNPNQVRHTRARSGITCWGGGSGATTPTCCGFSSRTW